jgi:geranyl-CoA carboxylase beta subunit
MPVYKSKVDVDSDDFAKNRVEQLDRIAQLDALKKVVSDLSIAKREKFEKREQLLPQERLARLLDPGMPFFEVGVLANYNPNDPKSIPGGNIIAGIGFVSGVRCAICVSNSAIAAGSQTTGGFNKMIRLQDMASKHKLPFIQLVESGGANLLEQKVDFFVLGGRFFRNLARLSAQGLPVITILHGGSVAGGAYMPGLSDYVIAVKKRGKAFLAGTALLKAATGEECDDEELGGAEMHASISGLAEYLAEDDTDAVRICRELVDKLGWSLQQPSTRADNVEPIYDIDELTGIVPMDYRIPYDVREVIARIVDGSDLLDFKPLYGPHTVCVQAKIFGYPVSFIGNNGPIDNEGATKATHFIQANCQSDTPIIYLQNTTGFMVGKDYEQNGMIKHGSKMIQAVSNATSAQITLMIGASFGAGNYGMCGRGYDPDFCLSWPNQQTGLMGGQQAAKTMAVVMEESAKRRNEALDPKMMEAQEKAIVEHFESQTDAFYTSGLGLDDGVIDPRDTRKVLGFLLATIKAGRARELHPNSFGVGRM